MFYGEDDATGFNNLDVDGGVGYALQAGFDYWIDDNWGINLDAKYINLDVDVKVNSGGTALSAKDVDLDPWIIGGGVSYRF
jgi:outer membrane protein